MSIFTFVFGNRIPFITAISYKMAQIQGTQSILSRFIKNGQIDISAGQLAELAQRHGGKDPIVMEIVNRIRDGTLVYPLKKYFMTPPSVLANNKTRAHFVEKEYVRNMVRDFPFLRSETRKYNGKEIALLFYPEDYEDLDIMSDYFTEIVRVECAIKGKQSPITSFAVYANNIAEYAYYKALRTKTHLNTKALSDAIFEVRIGANKMPIKMCTTFKISVAMAIYNAFRPQIVYDPSAGWGDRLCAAALSDTVKVYVGTDPNTALIGPYEQIVKYLSTYRTNTQMEVYDRGAESIDLDAIFGPPGSATNYDFILNSPPFFDYELYSAAASQSVNLHSKYQEWLTQWFFVVTKKNWTHLKQGGHLVYHLGVVPEHPIIQPIIDYMKGFVDAEFLGQISLLNAQNDKHRPIFLYVWRKRVSQVLLPVALPVTFALPYKYEMQEYVAPKPNIIAEVKRFVLMQQCIDGITAAISTRFRNPPPTIRYAVERHLAEMIMNQWSERAFINRNDAKVVLDEPFFLMPTQQEMELFISDLNYRINKGLIAKGRKEIVLKLKMENITSFFTSAIAQMNSGWRKVPYELEGEKAIFKVIPDGSDFTIFQLQNLASVFTVDSAINIITQRLPKFLRVSNDDLNMMRKRFGNREGNANEAILIVLIRYAALNAGSHQYILDMKYKELLREKFGADFECFASGLNATYSQFCSLFPDVEAPFGSKGNFVGLRMKSGYFQANPPYNVVALERMYYKVAEVMAESGPIVYTISIPYREQHPLKDRIDSEGLFVATMDKKERFHVTLNRQEMVDIPEYHHYIFVNEAGKKAIGEDGVRELIKVIREYKQ